jgi:hypothetical protein
MNMPLQETLDRLANIERMIEEGHKRAALYAPLVQMLMPKWKSAQLCGMGVVGMSIHLPVREWKRQHEAGVDRCLGFDIAYYSVRERD